MSAARILLLGLAVCAAGGCASLWRSYSAGLQLVFSLEQKLPDAWIDKIHPGVIYARWTAPGPMDVHVLAVDLKRKDLYFRPILGSGRIDGGEATRERLTVMARRSGALAALSGDYRAAKLNIAGLTIIDGKVHLAPLPPRRSALVIGRKSRVWMGRLHPARDRGPDYFQAIGGGPMLMRLGVFKWDREEEDRINGEDLAVDPRPIDESDAQAAVCVSRRRRFMYWVYVEAPSEDSLGMTPPELGDLLKRLGCWEALRLAGGAVAGMSVGGRRVGRYAAPGPRIGSALGLFKVRGDPRQWRRMRRPWIRH